MNYPVLTNPPIQEAIVAVHFAEEVGKEALVRFTENESVKAQYRVISIPNLRLNINLPTSPEAAVNRTDSVDTYLAHSLDKQRVALQIRPDSLSIHMLKEYKEFTELIETFNQTWSVFTQAAGAVPVRKIAVRYINKIEGKPTTDRFKLYVQTPFSEESSGNVFVQLRVNHTDDRRIHAIITEAVELDEQTKQPFTILDIDTQMEWQAAESPNWDVVFSTLRQFKNDLFYSIVTQQTLEPYY